MARNDYKLTEGSTSRLIDVFIELASAPGKGKTGLVFNSTNLTCYYYLNDAASSTAVTLATMTLGTWATGGFKQVDATNLPGVYSFGIPDAALVGAESVVVYFFEKTTTALDINPTVINIDLSTADISAYLGDGGPGIWYDENGPTSGTILGVDGTARNMVNDEAAAKTLADDFGVPIIYIHGDSDFVVPENMEQYIFIGTGQPTNKVTANSKSLGGSVFRNLRATGVSTAGATAVHMYGGGYINYTGRMQSYGSTDLIGTLNLEDTENSQFRGGSQGDVTLVFGATSGNALFRGHNGHITVTTMGSGNQLEFYGIGKLTLTAGVTGGTIILGGMIELDDSSTGTTFTQTSRLTRKTIRDDVWNEDATAHQIQGTFGQAIGDPVADTTTIYQAVATDAAGDNVSIDVAAIKAETALIVADTNELQTDNVPGLIATAQADLDIITGASGVNLLTATQASIDAIEADTNELQTDNIPGLIATAQADLDIITGASGVNLLTATQASIDAIESDTNELQSDDVPGLIAALDAVVDGVQSDLDNATDGLGAIKADTAAILIDTSTTLDTKLNDIQGATFNSATDSLESIRDRGDAAWTTGTGTGLTALASGTAQGGTTSTIQLASGETFADNELNGTVVNIHTGTGAGQSRVITAYTGATDTATISPTWTTTPDATSQYEVVNGSVNVTVVSNVAEDIATATALTTVDTVVDGIQTDLDNATDGLGAIKADTAAILTDTADIQPNYATAAALATVDSNVDAILVDTGTTLDAALAVVDANVDAILVDTGTTLDAALAVVDANVDAILADTADIQPNYATSTALATVDTVVDAIKAKTDSLTFTEPGEVDSNVQSINGAGVVGDGNATPWDGE